MYRLSYRGHDFVIFRTNALTEITIESLDVEITLQVSDLSAGVRAAKAAIDGAVASRPTRYLQRIS